MKRIAVITGGSSGLGAEFVKILDNVRDVDEMWLISRRAGNTSKTASLSKKCVFFPLDLSEKDSISVVREALEKDADVCIKYLVNSAGFGAFGSSEDIGLETERNMVDLNINALISMCGVCVPYMERGSRIINIASQASFQPLPYLNVYAASKAFVRSYTLSLGVELKKKGITATAVCPGWMKTPFLERGEIGAKNTITNFSGMTSAETVARKAFKDAEKGKRISVCGLFVKVCRFASRLFPESFAMKVWLRMQHIS